jgi:hypothetical protein
VPQCAFIVGLALVDWMADLAEEAAATEFFEAVSKLPPFELGEDFG